MTNEQELNLLRKVEILEAEIKSLKDDQTKIIGHVRTILDFIDDLNEQDKKVLTLLTGLKVPVYTGEVYDR